MFSNKPAGNYAVHQDHIRGFFLAIRLKLLYHPPEPFSPLPPIADRDDRVGVVFLAISPKSLYHLPLKEIPPFSVVHPTFC